MSAALVTRNLGRYYGQVVGLNELSVEIEGGVVGLVGPNGAGKSTLLKLIAGELRPSRGELIVLGEEPFANRRLYERVGFCPQQDALYDDMTGLELVRLLLRLAGFPRADADTRARRALARVDLEGDMHRRVGGYSKGMRQRAKIAQAIAHDPELLVLDEPLNGLDPIGRRDVLALLHDLGERGTHVLISSHVLHEIETLTENILLLHRGRLLARGTVTEVRKLLSQHPRRIELAADRPRELARELVACEDVVSIRLIPENGTLSLETRDAERFYRHLTSVAAGGGFGIQRMESLDAGLEAVFDYMVS